MHLVTNDISCVTIKYIETVSKMVVAGEPGVTEVTRVVEAQPTFTKVTRVIDGMSFCCTSVFVFIYIYVWHMTFDNCSYAGSQIDAEGKTVEGQFIQST